MQAIAIPDGIMATDKRLERNKVYTISYRCEIGGPGEPYTEKGVIDAFWTGEIDTWGKRTFQRVDGGPTLYLFPRELVSVDDY